MALIDAENLNKHFGIVHAVDNISLRVEEGEIWGLLGSKGAGKTTTVKLILGLLKPDSGHIRVFGENPWDNADLRRRIGVVSEKPFFPSHQTTQDYLERACRIYGTPLPRAREVLQLVNLTETNQKKIRTLTPRMLQKFAVAHALIHHPKLVIADEMITNLAPEDRSALLDLILHLRKEENVSFLLSSQILPELSEVCNMVALMDHGRVLAQGKIDELSEQFSAETIRINTDQPEKLAELTKTLSYVEHISTDSKGISVKATEGNEDKLREDVINLATKNQVKIQNVESESISMDMLYRQITTRKGETQK